MKKEISVYSNDNLLVMSFFDSRLFKSGSVQQIVIEMKLLITQNSFQGEKEIRFELFDLEELIKDLTKIIEKNLKSCCFNPTLDPTIEIRFEKVDIEHTLVKTKMFDDLYKCKLEIEFVIGRYQVEALIEQISSFLSSLECLALPRS